MSPRNLDLGTTLQILSNFIQYPTFCLIGFFRDIINKVNDVTHRKKVKMKLVTADHARYVTQKFAEKIKYKNNWTRAHLYGDIVFIT